MLEQLDLTAALLLLRTDSCVCCSGEQTDLWSGFGSLFSNKVNVCTEITPAREFTWELGADRRLVATRGRCRRLGTTYLHLVFFLLKSSRNNEKI